MVTGKIPVGETSSVASQDFKKYKSKILEKGKKLLSKHKEMEGIVNMGTA
jgi:hypothetical protein